jgi:hypothetical protein
MKRRMLLSASAWGLHVSFLLLTLLVTPALLTAAAKRPAQLPEDLAAVPQHAMGFVHVRVSDLWNSPPVRFALGQLDPKAVEEINRNLERGIGLSFAEVDRITIVVTPPQPSKLPDSFIIVQTLKVLDKERLLKELLPNAKLDSVTGIYASSEQPSQVLRFVGDRVVVIGTMDGVKFQATKPAKPEGLLAAALTEAAGGHQITCGFQMSQEVSAQLRELLIGGPSANHPFWTSAFAWVFDVQRGLIVIDAGYKTNCRVELAFSGAWQAKRAFRTAHGSIMLMQALCAFGQNQFKASRHIGQLLSTLEHALDEATVEVKGTTVQGTLQVNFPPAAVDQAMLEVFQSATMTATPFQGGGNIGVLVHAMFQYHQQTGHLPCHAIYGGDGQALLSWRVALLPYLGHADLYKQFKLNEPWNSVHNRQLLAKMPKVFETPDASAPPGYTHFQVVVTPEKYSGKFSTAFPQTSQVLVRLNHLESLDGLPNVVLIVEADKAVPWTAPEDIILIADDKVLPKFGAVASAGKFRIAFADGAVYYIRTSVADADYQRLMRQMLGIGDGENASTAGILEAIENSTVPKIDGKLPATPPGGTKPNGTKPNGTKPGGKPQPPK